MFVAMVSGLELLNF